MSYELVVALIVTAGIGTFIGTYIRAARALDLTHPANWCNLYGHKWRLEISGYRACDNCGHVAFTEVPR